MIRKLAIGAATVSLAAAGIVATGGGVATAATPSSLGTSRQRHLQHHGQGQASPALKNNWVQAHHHE